MPRILLVDNQPDRTEAIRRALEEAHYEVVAASSSSYALTMLEWDRPHIVVSQAEMPPPDGYELCSIVRSDPKTRNLLFLLLTGLTGPVPGAPSRSGVDVVLGGDFKPPDVVASVRRLLTRVGPLGRVLVVDDSAGVRKALELALGEHHVTVLLAASGREAMELIERDAPDIVVCDVHMPGKDGYQVCEFAKTRPGRRPIPVILMSGDAEESAMRAARVPPDDVMRKPFAPGELASKIERLLSKGADAPPPAVPTEADLGPWAKRPATLQRK